MNSKLVKKLEALEKRAKRKNIPNGLEAFYKEVNKHDHLFYPSTFKDTVL